MKHRTTEVFIKHAIETHGNKYDYNKVKYINSKTKVKIICKIHGLFEQTPSNHLFGKGCKKCSTIETSLKLKKTTDDFIKKVIEIHGDKYNYYKVEYKNAHTKIKIECKIHGEFEQTPNSHLRGSGCIECWKNK